MTGTANDEIYDWKKATGKKCLQKKTRKFYYSSMFQVRKKKNIYKYR